MHTQDKRWREREREETRMSQLVMRRKAYTHVCLGSCLESTGLGEQRAGLQDTVITGTEVCEHISNGHISDSGSQDDREQPL